MILRLFWSLRVIFRGKRADIWDSLFISHCNIAKTEVQHVLQLSSKKKGVLFKTEDDFQNFLIWMVLSCHSFWRCSCLFFMHPCCGVMKWLYQCSKPNGEFCLSRPLWATHDLNGDTAKQRLVWPVSLDWSPLNNLSWTFHNIPLNPHCLIEIFIVAYYNPHLTG